MDELLDTYILNTLRSTGFSICNTRALHLLKAIFLKKLLLHSRTLKHITTHAGRHKTITTDLFNFTTKIEKPHEYPHQPLSYENEVQVHAEKFNNEIASKIDRYIHIYEFMPEFPPTHTFKRTYIKNAKRHEIRIKERVEQNLNAERGVFQMIRVEKKMPKSVNFMDYMEN